VIPIAAEDGYGSKSTDTDLTGFIYSYIFASMLALFKRRTKELLVLFSA
jgi:hypothetical protein